MTKLYTNLIKNAFIPWLDSLSSWCDKYREYVPSLNMIKCLSLAKIFEDERIKNINNFLPPLLRDNIQEMVELLTMSYDKFKDSTQHDLLMSFVNNVIDSSVKTIEVYKFAFQIDV